jgi:DNA-binding GntR family transcriptional regulator
VARALQNQIAGGEYPIGSLLPTEIDLAKRHGVSRQTIRQAVQQLRQQKLLSAKKGVGTRVETRHPHRAYYFALESLTQIFQFASEAALHVHEEKEIQARGALANKLACRPGRSWLRIAGTRQVAGDPVPICWTEAYIDGRYASLLRGTKIHQSAIFSSIERHFGETVTEVKQEIIATVLNRDLAARLLAREGSPALIITRRYFGAGQRLIEMSINVHPSDRFSYAISLKRDLPETQQVG